MVAALARRAGLALAAAGGGGERGERAEVCVGGVGLGRFGGAVGGGWEVLGGVWKVCGWGAFSLGLVWAGSWEELGFA